MVESQTLMVQTDGDVVGQINGLAVMHSGPLTYGFPARITATIGPGSAGLINIEGRAQMSGAIHTKGFHILGGLLRHLLRTEHPMAFSASLAFEQSYGGIDGDSASGAEIVCLLSALTGIPIKQSMAMTGAIDQHGHLEAIGGVNEKVEGFFDACDYFGLNGRQGVVVPKSNAGDLMLSERVVGACRQGKFHVFAVDNIYDAIELMTGQTAGQADDQGVYPAESLLAKAHDEIENFWRLTLASPVKPPQIQPVGGSGDDQSIMPKSGEGDEI
jgi:ATP-dependent Lon protease